MPGETFAALVPPTGAAFVPGHAARASQIERVRQNFAVLSRARYWHLGSASLVGHVNTAYAWAEDANTITLCDELVRGLTCTLRVWVKVADLSGTVRVRLQNIDDGVPCAELPAGIAALDWTLFETPVTVPAGATPKACRLEIVAGLASVPAYYRGAQLEVKL
jgi:hypothetical protein